MFIWLGWNRTKESPKKTKGKNKRNDEKKQKQKRKEHTKGGANFLEFSV